MISNKILKAKGLFRFIQNYTRYSFADFPTDSDMKYLKRLRMPSKPLTDDLRFPYENSEFNGGVKQITEYLKQNAGFELKPLNVAFIMYNCAISNLYEPLIFEEIERNFFKYTGRFRPRWAFGCLYGIYKTNAGSLKGINLFEQEFLSLIKEISSTEVAQVVEALSWNTQLSREHKYAFLKTNLQPAIFEKWEKDLEYQPNMLLELFRAAIRMEYFDKELFEKLFDAIRKKKQLRRTKYAKEFFETLSELHEKGLFYRDLTDEINAQRQILESRHSVTWRYNLDERRELDYFELKAKRDDFKYLDQFQSIYSSQVTEEDILERRDREEKRAQFKRDYEKEQAMNEIVREQYVRLLRGDAETGLEDFDEYDAEVDAETEEDVAEWQKLEEGKGNEFIDMTKIKEPKAKTTPEELAKIKEKQKQDKKITRAILKDSTNK